MGIDFNKAFDIFPNIKLLQVLKKPGFFNGLLTWFGDHFADKFWTAYFSWTLFWK